MSLFAVSVLLFTTTTSCHCADGLIDSHASLFPLAASSASSVSFPCQSSTLTSPTNDVPLKLTVLILLITAAVLHESIAIIKIPIIYMILLLFHMTCVTSTIFIPTQIVAGGARTCVLSQNNTVKCFGYNYAGALGYGHTNNIGDEPGQMGDSLNTIDLGMNFIPTQIVAGFGHTCALSHNNTVKCFGEGYSGQLGYGDGLDRGDEAGEMGDALKTIDLGTNFIPTQISAGSSHTCALSLSNTVKCFGNNMFGQLGYGHKNNTGNEPGQMGDNLNIIDLGTNFIPTQISAGGYHTCALSQNKTVKCFGHGWYGQLGYGDTHLGTKPGQMGDNLNIIDLGTNFIPKQIFAGLHRTCILSESNTLKCFGDNNQGQLGYGDDIGRGFNANQMGDNLTLIDLGTNFIPTQISPGSSHTCALSQNKTVKCFGRNAEGQLGYGHTDNTGNEPGEMGDSLNTIDLGTNFIATQISVGGEHTCALSESNAMKCFGQNNYGQLGLGDTNNRGAAEGEMGDALKNIYLQSTATPTASPTNATSAPTSPTNAPNGNPTSTPTSHPSRSPTNAPTNNPTSAPTSGPTRSPLDCPYNTFWHDMINECFECSADHIGYECKGGDRDSFTVEYGYWVSAHHKDELSIVASLHNITNNHSIISLQCPMGQCCLDAEGCDYFHNTSLPGSISPDLCAKNRNTSSVACSRCNDGYDELFGSFVCGNECKDTDYWLLSLLFILALIFTVFLLFVISQPNVLPTNITRKQKEIHWRKLLLRDQTNLLFILISKICMYYYQGLNQILSAKNISVSSPFEKTLLNLFDFDLSLFSSANGICFIAGIDSGLYKVLVSYTWYGFVAVNVLMIALLSRARCLCRRIPYIKIGCINFILMTAGPLLSISFKVFRCTRYFDDKDYHFFDAEVACYGSIWWLAGLLPIIIFCGTLVLFWHIIRKQSAQQREDESNPYRTFTKRFHYKLWYWEFVLFVRRLGIAALTSFIGVPGPFIRIGLTSFIAFLLALQTHFSPFKYQRANILESVCLFGTVAVMIALIVMDDNSPYVSWYLTILILGPFCIVCIIILDIVYKRCTFKKVDVLTKQRLERRWLQTALEMPLQRIKSRISIQEQIQDADSLHQLMHFIERIDVDDLKRILVAHYDAINATGDITHGKATRTSTLYLGEDDEVIEATGVHRRDGYREPSLSTVDMDRQDSSNDVDGDTDEANNEQQQSIKLYQTNRNMWRHKMTTTIRQSPNQFAMILKMLKNNDSDDASLTKNEFETAFAALNNSLIECMFEDIGSFEGKGNDEERLKLTTIGRWMEFESFLFEEVECVNDQRIIVSLHHELDQYLEYKSDDNGKGAIIQRMKTNEYGKQLDERYGLSKTEWCIVSVNGETVNDKMENEIDYILKQVDLNKGYQLTLVKKGKEDHVQIELAAENISKNEAKEDNVSEQDDGVNELVGFADAYFETDYI